MQSKRKHNRSRIEIASDILKVCQTPQHFYRVVQKANLSFSLTTEMVDYLLLRGFLQKTGPLYATTDFGNEFAMALKTVFDVWNAPRYVLSFPD